VQGRFGLESEFISSLGSRGRRQGRPLGCRWARARRRRARARRPRVQREEVARSRTCAAISFPTNPAIPA